MRKFHRILLSLIPVMLFLVISGCGDDKTTGKDGSSSKFQTDTLAKTDASEFESKYILPEITPEVKALIRACNNFERQYAQDERVPSVLLKEGEAYYFFKHYDKALEAFGKIYDNYPEGEEYLVACENIAKINFDMGNYSEAERWYATTREISKSLGKTETMERVTKLEAASSFKYAETKGVEVTEVESPEEIPPEVREKALEQAKLFEETADKNPDTEIGMRSLGKAAETYQKIYDWENTARVYLKYAEEYPDQEDVPDAIASAAQSYEKIEEWEKAAETYKLLYEDPRWTDENFAVEAIFYAALNYEKAERWSKAEELFRRYRESPKAMDAGHIVEAAFKMAKAQEKQGHYNDAMKSYEECVAVYDYAIEKGFEIEELAYYPAESQYIVAENLVDEYKDIELTMPEDVMKKNLEKKVELYQKLEKMYNKVVSYKVQEWLSAPIYRLGEINENFANTLRNSEYPPDLTPEEFAQYAAALENEAFPMEQKAIEYYNNLMTVAENFGITDEWTTQAQERLIALNPGVYAMVEDFSGVNVISDTSWKCKTTTPSPDWNMATFDNTTWENATEGMIEEDHIDDIKLFKGLEGTQFIWAPFETEKPPQMVYFTKKISFHEQPPPREAKISAKEHYKFYVNGVLVGQDDPEEGDEWETAETYDLSPYLKVGDNMLAVEVISKDDDEYWFRFECYETE